MSDDVQAAPELPDDIGALQVLVGEKLAQLREKDLRIAVLEEQLRLATHKRFGSSSETFDPDQLGLFNEAEVTAAEPETPVAEITVPEHTRQKSGRKPLADHLPRVRVEHDIAATEKMCPCSSGCEQIGRAHV